MTTLRLTLDVDCAPQRVRELLLTESFLDAFVAEQHPVQHAVRVDSPRQRSECDWTIDLEGDLPSLVARFVGRRADIRLVFDLRDHRILLDAKAKRDGHLSCSMHVVPAGAGRAEIVIDGSLHVSGAFGGMAEGTVKDQVIVPVLKEDLVRLLEQWSSGRP